tara:strand:- start:48 stop:332 length:285 start_codon:yes stop_codon:yes gene_type:complete
MCLNCCTNLTGEIMYTVITRNNCKYCDKAKTLLKADSIPYVSYNVEDNSSKWVLSLLKEANIKTVPQVFAHDGNYVGGYRELEEVLGHASEKEY